MGIKILPDTTKNPLSLMGQVAGVCWGVKDSSIEADIKRAKDCIKSGHGRVQEWVNVDCVVSGFSAKMMREAMRHIVGTSVLQASTRYIDYSKQFQTIIPKKVRENEEAVEIWAKTVQSIHEGMTALKKLGIPTEDFTNVLPLAYESKMVWKINLRSLANFYNLRLCNRAYWEIRDFAAQLRQKLSEYSEEWAEVCDMLLIPKCKQYGYCNETKSCGMMPKKEEVLG